MFNSSVRQTKFSCFDKYRLTEAAIKGVKTQRRVIAGWESKKGSDISTITPPAFNVGDEPTLIQPYRDVPELAGMGLENDCGWDNKMFAKIDKLPYKAVIKGVRLERLQDITNEDAMKEGIRIYKCEDLPDVYSFFGNKTRNLYATPREAFRAMCDGLFGYGVWRRNPDVYVYDFEIVRK